MPDRVTNHSRPRRFDRWLSSSTLLAAITLALACQTPKEYVWTDARRGYRVESDFPQITFEMSCAEHLDTTLTQLDEIFGSVDLSSLTIFVHNAPVGGLENRARGQHQPGRIDLWAGFDLQAPDGSPVEFPRTDTETTVHEFVHAYIDSNSHDVPRWLEEGLATAMGHIVRDESGHWQLLRSAAHERGARDAVAGGADFSDEQLFSFADRSPPGDRWDVFYPQTASMARFLLESQAGALPEQVRAVMALGPEEHAAAARLWRKQLAAEPLNAWFAAQALSTSAAIRDALADDAGFLDRDDSWLAMGEILLGDPARGVRSSARIRYTYLAPPDHDQDFIERVATFAESDKLQVRLAGLAGLAQTGDLDAGLTLLDTVAGEVVGREWEQALLWLALRIRGRPEKFTYTPLFTAGPEAVTLWAGAFAHWIRKNREAIHWDTERWVYQFEDGTG